MQTFFAVLTLDRFDELKRQVGYARAVALLDALRDDVAAQLPGAQHLRANRNTVEFMFHCRSASDARRLLTLLRASLDQEIPVRGQSIRRTIVIAAVRCGRATLSQSLVEQAEDALRQAVRDAVGLVISEAGSTELDDCRLMDDLHAAMRADTLALHYQPKLRARTGELASVEALLRWNHPDRGAVSPERFIPMAERNGDIGALTEWVIARAVADQAQLRLTGLDLPIHINISAALAADPRFVDAALAQLGANASTIGFEITETAMMADPDGTRANLQRLADAGIRLAIDDYGSGFSSLAYLQRLPVHELKIDKMFVSRLSSGARDPLLVRSTIDLAHALEMEVTAEGVETAATLALLQVMRCDMVQGYFLSPALALAGLIDFARKTLAEPSLPRPASLAERVAARRSERGQAA